MLPLDVQDRASIDAALRAAVDRFGGLDVVVNNAGFGLHGLFETTPREKVMEQFEVNLFGVMDVIRATLPYFARRGGGTFVNVSSGAGVFTLPMISLYCASKFALEGFSEALSYELTSQNVRVKIVEPGGVLDTGFVSRSADESAQSAVPARYAAYAQATERTGRARAPPPKAWPASSMRPPPTRANACASWRPRTSSPSSRCDARRPRTPTSPSCGGVSSPGAPPAMQPPGSRCPEPRRQGVASC
ncbi:SDR family NAD(P)-dependent oxidoreductase [Myxococcus sp. 1LA]